MCALKTRLTYVMTMLKIFHNINTNTFLCDRFLLQITDLGRTRTLSTYLSRATYINPTILKVDIPTSYRKKRSPSINIYASGFYISLSYNGKNISDSMTLVIYNDLCYSCSALTMECNMTVRKHFCCTRFENGIKTLISILISYSFLSLQ